MKIAQIKNLCKVYPAFTLSDLSFDLEEGHITGFIGRNGAGKTTTIKSILNLVHPTSGEISYFGMPLAGHEDEIKRRIGYSTGAVNYYPKKKSKISRPSPKPFTPTGTRNPTKNISSFLLWMRTNPPPSSRKA